MFGGIASFPLREVRVCNKFACPLDCQVSLWGVWGLCTRECGGGSQMRTRRIKSPAQHGGVACPSLVRTKSCRMECCAIPCVPSDWSAWSPCSNTCGGGTQTRSRTVLAHAVCHGTPCTHLHQSQACNQHACPSNESAQTAPCSVT